MRSILPPPLLAASLLALLACESQDHPGVEAGAEQDAEASEHDADGSDRDAEASAPSAPKPTLEELTQEYRAWSPHPDQPQAVSAGIAFLCRLPSAAEEAFVASEHGHERYLQNWLNPAAKRGFDAQRAPFEVGAAIVKEKLVRDATGMYRVAARGFMIKRAAGFDPTHGDWEFGYWEVGSELRRGDDAARSCGGCHASADTDFVFLDGRWRLQP